MVRPAQERADRAVGQALDGGHELRSDRLLEGVSLKPDQVRLPGGDEVSLYGGEGTISNVASFQFAEENRPSMEFTLDEWRVRFKNTPSEQEFTITHAKR